MPSSVWMAERIISTSPSLRTVTLTIGRCVSMPDVISASTVLRMRPLIPLISLSTSALIALNSGRYASVMSDAMRVTSLTALSASRLIPMARPCEVYWPMSRNTRDGELIPSNDLAAPIASLTTDLAAETALPAALLMPFTNPPIKSTPALTIDPIKPLTLLTIRLPIETTALTALAPPETIAETKRAIPEAILDTIGLTKLISELMTLNTKLLIDDSELASPGEIQD